MTTASPVPTTPPVVTWLDRPFPIRGQLPVRATPLFGREAEATAVTALLARADVRLVTLSGPGGVGKTHLALHCATSLHARFPDGLYWVPLSETRDRRQVALALAAALSLKEDGDLPLEVRLCASLRAKTCLLVCDNFEQALVATPLLAEILNSAPTVKFLITSRTALRVLGESVYTVAPLPVPTLNPAAPLDTPTLDALAHVPAVALFMARAQAANPTLRLTAQNAPAVVGICANLEGLPLALELAAARTKLLSPQSILARMNSGGGRLGTMYISALQALAAGAGDLAPRQHTLRGMLEWSYDLLSPVEQLTFTALAVFIGGCTLDAAQRVLPSAEHPLVETLNELSAHSLVQRVSSSDGIPRFVMLETVREYARDLLASSGLDTDLHDAHLAYYLDLVETAEPELTGPRQGAWLARLDAEHDNLRAALDWALSRETANLALRLSGALWRFWWLRGYVSEGRRWLDRVLLYGRERGFVLELGAERQTHAHWLASVYHGLGVLAWSQGANSEARTAYEQCLELRRATGDVNGIAMMLNNLGHLALLAGDYVRARTLLEECLAMQSTMQNLWVHAFALVNLATVAFHGGDSARAQALYAESLALRRKIGDDRGAAAVLVLQGYVSLAEGVDAQARPPLLESLATFYALKHPSGMAECLVGLAGVALHMGDAVRAARYTSAAEHWRTALSARVMPEMQSFYAQLVEDVRRACAVDVRCAQAWEAGRTRALDSIAAEALADQIPADEGNQENEEPGAPA